MLKCPEQGCGKSLNEGFLKRLLTAETFEKYKQFLLSHDVQVSNDKKFCP